ncbi:M20 aminoacylase family protein [Paraburkholderia tropica]|uniref:Hippurate hydrolase n=1 Tax=Paraburkholderia tropica TaxID=92647 RepID=A0A1A5WYU3_9BURK|nr:MULTISPECIES: M20 aminoacylase family protein [Paraburkholderia]MBB2981698.1 hippurate hydrolase [Paraburkholderia tropica]MDE1138412.1 M20 family metallopeptidase [Paraburkholderia tropica]OBR46377.1 amidohydrolase [Paraburkholderia tropica]PXX11802.1 hippurate hydrolase [Paraburkholderia tropica]PZW77211.1 hippurate hydrolase [Paraburkholderia tropica]
MNTMAIPPEIAAIEAEMIALRHAIHAHPELGYEEFVTGDLVAQRLAEWGYEVHRGLGGTGVVGTLKAGDGTRRLGLRADMDALPIHEATGLDYASRIPGKMHACGHDGHTAMLLAAARHLAQSRSFNGTLHLIFQPAEEGLGGAKRMLDEGLFERFPCDAVFAMHNMPGFPTGKLGFRAGPFMASSDTVVIDIDGRGGHGAVPHKAIDPVVVCANVVLALQTIVSRNVPPLEMAIVTVGAIHAGDAPNVIPQTAQMKLSVRALRPDVRDLLEERITALVHAQASVYGATARIDYQRRYPVLVNEPAMTAFAQDVARDWLGEGGLIHDMDPLTGSEDFAFLLEHCAGSYLIIGNGDGEGGCMVHNPGYDFNDDCLATGAAYWVKLTERFLQP